MHKLLLLAAFVTALVVAMPGHAQSVTWELANEYPATSLAGEGDLYFANRVEELTKGRMHIVPRFDGVLGYKSRAQLSAVASGKLVMADSFAGGLGEEDALYLLSSLPFLTPTVADASKLFEIAHPAYESKFSERNQKLLFVSPWPPSGIWAKQAITSTGALRALKIRTYDATSAEVMKRAGTQAFNLSFNEVAAKLESGEINAVLSSGDGGAGRSLWKYLDHFSEINYAIPLSMVTVNLDAWNALAPPVQVAMQQAADETMARQWQQMEGRVEQNYRRMRENGMSIVTTIPEDVRVLLAGSAAAAVADWRNKTGDAGKTLLEKFNAAHTPTK